MKKLNARGFSHEILLVAFVAIFAIAGVAYLVASHAQTPCVNQTLRYGNHKNRAGVLYGSKGVCVKYAQRLANWKLTVKPKLHVTGYYDNATMSAIVAIQQQYGLFKNSPNMANYGKVAPSVWKVLCENSVAPGKGGPFYGSYALDYKLAGCSTLFPVPTPVSGSVSAPVMTPAKT